MLRSTQKNSLSIAQCSHAHSNHVRNVALQRVACEYHSSQFAHNHSGEFWGDKCCWLLREQVLGAGVRRQRRDLGGGDVVRLRRRPAAETSYVVNTKVLCWQFSARSSRRHAVTSIVTARRTLDCDGAPHARSSRRHAYPWCFFSAVCCSSFSAKCVAKVLAFLLFFWVCKSAGFSALCCSSFSASVSVAVSAAVSAAFLNLQSCCCFCSSFCSSASG